MAIFVTRRPGKRSEAPSSLPGGPGSYPDGHLRFPAGRETIRGAIFV